MSKAELRVSSCGRFAILVFPLGYFFFVWSKEYALRVIEDCFEAGTVTEDDAARLLLAVTESILPLINEYVSVAIIDALTHCNVKIGEAAVAGVPVLYDEATIQACIKRFEKHYSARYN